MERISPGRRVAWPAPAVAVGNFDGVHRGHRALVAVALEEARVLGGTAAVLTFEPHPSRVLFPERAATTLMTLDQKGEALGAYVDDEDRFVMFGGVTNNQNYSDVWELVPIG